MKPTTLFSFKEFIKRGFIECSQDNIPRSISPIIIAFKQLLEVYELLYIAMEDNVKKEIINNNVSILPYEEVSSIFEDGNIGNIFDKVVLALYIPLCNMSILFRVSTERLYEFDIELCNGFLMMHIDVPIPGNHIVFYRLSGKSDGICIFKYIESRFNIYNLKLRKLEFDDIALDKKVSTMYIISTLRDLTYEMIECSNIFFINTE